MTISKKRDRIAAAKDRGTYRPTRAEQARLKRILDSELYGPKLVRLNKGEQRIILDMISANEGAAARDLILELDEARRTKNRVMARAARYANLTRAQRITNRPDDEEALFWRLYEGIVA